MLSIKENFYETLKPTGNPDRIVNGFEFMKLIVPDPALLFTHVKLEPGNTGKDGWGVTWTWPEDQPAAVPFHTPDNLVIKDIHDWKNQLKLPGLANADLDWTDAKARADAVDRDKFLLSAFLISGIFERLHMLMGFEEALVNMMLEPDTMRELCDAICEHRLVHAKLLIENLHPDIILTHDDWGMKTALFMPPDVWREVLKPAYEKLYGYLKSENILIMHHADSFMEPIAEDMVDLGIDIWQGVLPQNDIVRMQELLDGRMILMGGIDASVVDTAFTTEKTIRDETRRACECYGPHGHFIPCLTYGEPDVGLYPNVESMIKDEINADNKRVYGIGA